MEEFNWIGKRKGKAGGGQKKLQEKESALTSKTSSSDQVPSAGTTCTPLFMEYFNPIGEYDNDF